MTVLAGWAIGDAVKTCVPSSLRPLLRSRERALTPSSRSQRLCVSPLLFSRRTSKRLKLSLTLADFFVTPDNGLQFKLCSVFQLSVRRVSSSLLPLLPPRTGRLTHRPSPTQVDLMLCVQTFLYREQTARDLAERAELAQHRGVAGTEALLHADRERERDGAPGRGRGGRDETDEEAELETQGK